MFSDQYIQHEGKKYFAIEPKEVITPGMKIKYLSPHEMGELEIVDILDVKKKQIDKAHCNSGIVYITTDKPLEGWEILYE